MPFDLNDSSSCILASMLCIVFFFCHICSSYPKGKKEHLVTINNIFFLSKTILLVVLLILYPLIKSVIWFIVQLRAANWNFAISLYL